MIDQQSAVLGTFDFLLEKHYVMYSAFNRRFAIKWKCRTITVACFFHRVFDRSKLRVDFVHSQNKIYL